MIEGVLSRYEKWLKHKGDTFQTTLYEKIVRELMTLGGWSFRSFVCFCALVAPSCVLSGQASISQLGVPPKASRERQQ